MGFEEAQYLWSTRNWFLIRSNLKGSEVEFKGISYRIVMLQMKIKESTLSTETSECTFVGRRRRRE